MMKRLCQWLVLASILVALPSASFARGVENIRWRTTFSAVGGGEAQCDIYIFDMARAYTYPVNGTRNDGWLSVENVTYNDAGLVDRFSGKWSRLGGNGTFLFSVQYDGANRPVYLRGYYTSPDSRGIAMPWNGVPVN